MIQLERPLVILDLEATGTDPEKARIIQVALQRFEPDVGFTQAYTRVVNPGVQIPEKVQQLTGVTQQRAEEQGIDPEVAMEAIRLRIKDADLAGYNLLSYDVPLLEAEWKRHTTTPTGRPTSLPGRKDRRIIDAYQIEKRLRPRTLEGVFQRRTGKSLDDAHDAAEDVKATYEILEDQMSELQASQGEEITADAVIGFQRGGYLDAGQKLKERDDGSVEVCFGKYSGRTLSQLQEADPGYVDWMYREITELQPHIDSAIR